MAACREKHTGDVRIKLHTLSGSIGGSDGNPLDENLGAALGAVWLQLNAVLGDVPCQLAADLRDVRIVHSAPIYLSRRMYVVLHTTEPFLLIARLFCILCCYRH